MRRSYSAAGTFSLSLSRLDIEKPPGDIHRWRRTNLVVTGLWLLAFVQSPVKEILERRHASRNPNRKFLYLHLVFGVAGDDDPRMREDRDSPDVAIPIKGRVQEQSID